MPQGHDRPLCSMLGDVTVGDIVIFRQCQPLSKTVRFNVLEHEAGINTGRDIHDTDGKSTGRMCPGCTFFGIVTGAVIVISICFARSASVKL